MSAGSQLALGQAAPFRAVISVQVDAGSGAGVELLSCGHHGQRVGARPPARRRRCQVCVMDPVQQMIETVQVSEAAYARLRQEHLVALRLWQTTAEAQEVNAQALARRAEFVLLPGGLIDQPPSAPDLDSTAGEGKPAVSH